MSRSEVAAGDVLRPEIASSSGGPLRPHHEMHDPSTPPAELPGDPVGVEVEGSIPALSNQPSVSSSRRRSSNRNPVSPLSQSSGRVALLRRVSRGNRQSRDSIPNLHTTAPTPPPKAAANPSPPPPFRPASRRVPSNGIYSPLSNDDTMSPDDMGTATGEGRNIFSPVSPPIPEPSRGNILSRMTRMK